MRQSLSLNKLQSASTYAGIAGAATIWAVYRLITLLYHVDAVGRAAFPMRFWNRLRERVASRLVGHELGDAVEIWIEETGESDPDESQVKR